mgnify:CR=1 FL=1
MKPIEFKQQNVVFAKDQLEYLPLPAYRSPNKSGRVVTCWQLSWLERVKVLVTGRVWANQLTFQQALQPQKLCVDIPFELEGI